MFLEFYLGVASTAATKLLTSSFPLHYVHALISLQMGCLPTHPTPTYTCTHMYTGHQVWSILASGLTAARGGGVGTCLAVTVCSCVCSWGRRLCYHQVLSRCQESRLVQFSWQPAPTLCRRLERSDPRPIMAKYQGHKMKQAHLTNCRAAALKCRIYVSLNPGQLSRAHRLKCGAVWA